MGSVIQLKKQINNSYLDLRNSVEEKLVLVDEKIVSKLSSNVDLMHKMTKYLDSKLHEILVRIQPRTVFNPKPSH